MRPPHLAVVPLIVVTLSLLDVVAADSSTATDHAGNGLTFDAVDGERAHGTTPFMLGMFIGVRVKSVGDTHLFLVSKATRVGENGSFGITFDLSEMAQLRGGPVQVLVRRDQQPIYEENATPMTYYMPENPTLTPDIRDAVMVETTSVSTATTTGSSSGIDVPGFDVEVGVAALLVALFVAARGL